VINVLSSDKELQSEYRKTEWSVVDKKCIYKQHFNLM
jgi:hypothetical protein